MGIQVFLFVFHQKIVELMEEGMQSIILSTKVNLRRGKEIRIRTHTHRVFEYISQTSPRKLKAVFSRNKILKL